MAATPFEDHVNLTGIANPIVEILTPGGSTTPVNGWNGSVFVGDALTLTTQGKHAWEATITEALSGLYRYVIMSGTTPIKDGWVYLADDTVRVYGEASRAAALAASNFASITAKTDQLTFTVANQVDANALTSVGNTVTVVGGSSVASGDDLIVINSDDYYDTESRKVTFNSTGWPDLTGSTVTFRAKQEGAAPGFSAFAGQAAAGGGAGGTYAEIEMVKEAVGASPIEQVISMEITTLKSNLIAGSYFTHITAVLSNGHLVTLLRNEGGMTVQASVLDE